MIVVMRHLQHWTGRTKLIERAADDGVTIATANRALGELVNKGMIETVVHDQREGSTGRFGDPV